MQDTVAIEAGVQTDMLQPGEILQSLEERDSRRARRLTERPIVQGADYVIDLLEARNLWDEATE